jgi:hypothetical protein
MAGKKETQQQAVEKQRPNPPEYTREELLAGAANLFGVKPEVVAGALLGSGKEAYAIEEMGRLICQFQQRKVYL